MRWRFFDIFIFFVFWIRMSAYFDSDILLGGWSNFGNFHFYYNRFRRKFCINRRIFFVSTAIFTISMTQLEVIWRIEIVLNANNKIYFGIFSIASLQLFWSLIVFLHRNVKLFLLEWGPLYLVNFMKKIIIDNNIRPLVLHKIMTLFAL